MLTNAHLVASFLPDSGAVGRIRLLQPIQVLLPHERYAHLSPQQLQAVVPNQTQPAASSASSSSTDELTLEELQTHDRWLCFEGEIEYRSANIDLLLIRVRPPLPVGLHSPLPLALSPAARLLAHAGDAVYVLGYPTFPPAAGLGPTLTAGVLARVVQVPDAEGSVRSYHVACLLSSATVTAGNSGGMLLDAAGRLLGMVRCDVM